jgi:hypothetical protein
MRGWRLLGLAFLALWAMNIAISMWGRPLTVVELKHTVLLDFTRAAVITLLYYFLGLPRSQNKK